MKIQSLSTLTFALLASTAFGEFAEFTDNVYKVGDKQWVGIEQLQQSSAQGDALAQYTYAWALDEGKGINENDARAQTLFAQSIAGLKKLADEGNADAMAALGDIYEEGDGIAKDKKQAVEWFSKAVEKGHAYAMYSLAELYKDGEGVAKSITKAKELYSAAAQKGYRKATEELRELEHGDDD